MTSGAQVVLIALLGFSCAARQPVPPLDLSAVQAAERELDYEPTSNFERHGRRAGYRICYWTGPFELPDDYSDLRYREGKCSARSEGQDRFFYEPEALAGRETPVTRSLAEAAEQRRSFVTAHEDFHEQPGVRELDSARKEAFSTLAGLLTAAEAACIAHGAESEAYRLAVGETELFRRKSALVNRTHARLRELYGRVESRDLSSREGLIRKAEALRELEAECAAFEPGPQAFGICPAALNNAGLAFDATYTRRFEEAWAVYEAAGRDPAETLRRLREAAGTGR